MDDSIPSKMRRCTGCEEEFPPTLEYFYKQRGGKFGLNSKCKICADKRHKEYVEKNQEKVSAKQKQYYQDNIEWIHEKASRAYQENKEVIDTRKKAWRKAHPEFMQRMATNRHERYIAEKQKDERWLMRSQGFKWCPGCKQWKKATDENFHRFYSRFRAPCKACRHEEKEWTRYPERERIKSRRWKRNNPEKVRAISQRWRKNHSELARLICRRRRARKILAEGSHTIQDIQKIYERQKGKCYHCQKKVGKIYDIDHLVPLSRGGSDDPSNLVVACPTCNRRRGAKLLHEWEEGGRLL